MQREDTSILDSEDQTDRAEVEVEAEGAGPYQELPLLLPVAALGVGGHVGLGDGLDELPLLVGGLGLVTDGSLQLLPPPFLPVLLDQLPLGQTLAVVQDHWGRGGTQNRHSPDTWQTRGGSGRCVARSGGLRGSPWVTSPLAAKCYGREPYSTTSPSAKLRMPSQLSRTKMGVGWGGGDGGWTLGISAPQRGGP